MDEGKSDNFAYAVNGSDTFVDSHVVTGEHPTSASGSADPVAKVSALLEILAKGAGVGAACLYVGLEIVYQNFYAPLRISPEDVGVDQLFILGRTVGLLPFAAIPTMAFFFGRVFPFWWIALGSLGIVVALLLLALLVPDPYFSVREHVLSTILEAIVAGVPLTIGAVSNRHPDKVPRLLRVPWFLIAVCIAAFVIGATMFLSIRAAELAGDAQQGVTVNPEKMYGLTVIDVRATPSIATWIDDSSNRPVELFDNANKLSANYLGQSGDTAYFWQKDHVIRVPRDKVVVATAVGEYL